MATYNNQEKIREHYDEVSPYYYSLWGKHLHHGYWVTGKETKDEAQVALTEHLAQRAGIKPGMKILDVIKNKMFWRLALKHGKEFVSFLNSFKAMRNGFKSSTFVYGLIVMKKV